MKEALGQVVMEAPRHARRQSCKYSDRRASARAAEREWLNPKSVAKGRKAFNCGKSEETGPKKPRSTVSQKAEEGNDRLHSRHTPAPMDELPLRSPTRRFRIFHGQLCIGASAAWHSRLPRMSRATS